MSLSLFRRCLQPIFRAELPLRSIPAVSHQKRYLSEKTQTESEWENVSRSLPHLFAVKNPDEEWAKRSRSLIGHISPPPTAYSGRSIAVTNGDIAEAARKLDRVLVENNVWKELRLTQRHEKKGAKRRRLSSQRWRIRFKEEVREKVALVKQIRKRGS